MGSSPNDFSVVVLPSDFRIDARPFLTNQEREVEEEEKGIEIEFCREGGGIEGVFIYKMREM